MLYEKAIVPDLNPEDRRHLFETEYYSVLANFNAATKEVTYDEAMADVVDMHASQPDSFNDQAELFQLFKDEYLAEFDADSPVAQTVWERITSTNPGDILHAFMRWQEDRTDELLDDITLTRRIEIEQVCAEDDDIADINRAELRTIRILRLMDGSPSGLRPVARARSEEASVKIVDAQAKLNPDAFHNQSVLVAVYKAFHIEQSMQYGMTLAEATRDWKNRVLNTHINLEREVAAWSGQTTIFDAEDQPLGPQSN